MLAVFVFTLTAKSFMLVAVHEEVARRIYSR